MYTGNIVDGDKQGTSLTVYPCVYREHNGRRFFVILRFGLSLCIQGTLIRFRYSDNDSRFIPVYTGNIYLYNIFIFNTTVYPCVYREHTESI